MAARDNRGRFKRKDDIVAKIDKPVAPEKIYWVHPGGNGIYLRERGHRYDERWGGNLGVLLLGWNHGNSFSGCSDRVVKGFNPLYDYGAFNPTVDKRVKEIPNAVLDEYIKKASFYCCVAVMSNEQSKNLKFLIKAFIRNGWKATQFLGSHRNYCTFLYYLKTPKEYAA